MDTVCNNEKAVLECKHTEWLLLKKNLVANNIKMVIDITQILGIITSNRQT